MTAENVALPGRARRGGTRFNEAAADDRGKLEFGLARAAEQALLQ